MKIFQTSKKSVTKIKKICYLCHADSSLKRYPRSRPRLPHRGPRDVPGRVRRTLLADVPSRSVLLSWRRRPRPGFRPLRGPPPYPGKDGDATGPRVPRRRADAGERSSLRWVPGTGGGRPPPLSSASSIQAGPVGPPAAVHHHPKCYHPPPSRDAGGFLMRSHLPGNGKDAPCRARPADMVYVEDVGQVEAAPFHGSR